MFVNAIRAITPSAVLAHGHLLPTFLRGGLETDAPALVDIVLAPWHGGLFWFARCFGVLVLVVGPSGVGRPSKEENHRIRMNHHRRKESHSARLLHFGSLVTTHSYAILSYKEPSLLTEKE